MTRRPATHGRDDAGALLRLASTGDRRAFARFYDCTSDTAYLFARMVTDSDASAQRATEQAYLQVWRDAARMQDESLPAMAWLLDVVRRRARAGAGTDGPED